MLSIDLFPRICIPNEFPDDVDAVVPRTTVDETLALEKPSLVISYPQPDGAKIPSIHLFEFLLWSHARVYRNVFIIDFLKYCIK